MSTDVYIIEGDVEEMSPAIYKLDGDDLSHVRLRLFHFISQGEGGLQALLNLRKVSSLAKKWIDFLPPAQGQLIFTKGQVHLDLSVDGKLGEFVESPSPPHVSSLWLEFFHDDTFPPEEEENWERFVQIWTPPNRKLIYLSLGSFPTPYTARVLEFLTATSVRSVRFFWGSFRQYHFGEIYLQLEELWIDFRLDGIGTEDLAHFILGRLKENKGLKVLKLNACEEWAIEDIARIIEAKRDNGDFQLTLKFPTYSDAFNDNDASKRFIRSVASSKSKIFIECLPDPDASVNTFTQVLGHEITKEKLFPTVLSVCCYSDRPVLMELSQFPNLRQVWTSNPVNLPDTVEEVQIEIDDLLPSMEGLSRALTTLTLWIFLPQIPSDELMRSLITINEKCRSLKTFAIYRTFRWSEEGAEEEESLNVDLPARPFPNLNSFSLSVYCVEDELERAAVGVRLFLNGLLTRLGSLRKLSIISRQDMILLDKELLQSLLEGPAKESLCEVDLREQNVPEDALDLMSSLRSLAEENGRRRRETHGIRCGVIL